MNRIYVGACILMLLFAVCCISSYYLPQINLEISGQLEQAVQAVQDENWPQAVNFANQAALTWQRTHDLSTIAADHAPIDEIDTLFAELALYAQLEEQAQFAAISLQLSRLTAALGQSQVFSLWNLL